MTYNHTSRVLASAGDDSCIVLSHTETNDRLAYLEPNSFSPSPINSISFTSNSDKLGCGALDGSVRIWDLRKKEVTASFNHHTDSVSCVAWNCTDQQIASSSLSGEIVMHSLLTKVAVANCKQRGSAGIKVIQFSPFKKQMLGAGSENGSVYIWDTNTRTVASSFMNAHNSPVTGLAFSAVNDMLMCTGGLDQRINFYDTQDKKIVKTIEVDAPLTCISFCPDGHTLAGGTLFGTVLLYDLRLPGNAKSVLRGHDGNAVNWVEFAKNREARPRPVRETSRETSKEPLAAKNEYGAAATSKFRTVDEIKLEARMRVEQKKKEKMREGVKAEEKEKEREKEKENEKETEKEKGKEKVEPALQRAPLPTFVQGRLSGESRDGARSALVPSGSIVASSPSRVNLSPPREMQRTPGMPPNRTNSAGPHMANINPVQVFSNNVPAVENDIAEDSVVIEASKIANGHSEFNIRGLDNQESRNVLELIEQRLNYQDDAIFEVKDDIQNLQVEMIRQFMIQMV